MAEDHYSLSAKVFHTLREDILNGKYQAKEELKEADIGKEMGVSRTPVREALRQLELEGLVNIIPNKGAFVVGVTLKDIKDIYEMRTLLEGLCARWAAENITDQQIEKLDETIFLSEFHYAKENWDQILILDNRFHELVYEACGSRELTRALRDYHHYLQRIRKITLGQEERVKASNEEHKKIAEALKARDSAAAEESAKLHIRSTISNMDKIGWENLIKP